MHQTMLVHKIFISFFLAGVCTVRSLRNISMVEATIKEPVVANNATASTVAFIAPGPPNPPITQVGQLSILSPTFIPPSLQFHLYDSFHFLLLCWQPPLTSPLLSLGSIVN